MASYLEEGHTSKTNLYHEDCPVLPQSDWYIAEADEAYVCGIILATFIHAARKGGIKSIVCSKIWCTEDLADNMHHALGDLYKRSILWNEERKYCTLDY